AHGRPATEGMNEATSPSIPGRRRWRPLDPGFVHGPPARRAPMSFSFLRRLGFRQGRRLGQSRFGEALPRPSANDTPALAPPRPRARRRPPPPAAAALPPRRAHPGVRRAEPVALKGGLQDVRTAGLKRQQRNDALHHAPRRLVPSPLVGEG